jgi:hypothetical protein
MEDYTDNTFLAEVMLNFDQILCFTTFDLWNQHKDRARKTAAGINLNSKMKAMKTINATESTALAIAKAAENANANQLAMLESNLRISNLENSARKQEQKSNEIINHLKPTSKKTHQEAMQRSPWPLQRDRLLLMQKKEPNIS